MSAVGHPNSLYREGIEGTKELIFFTGGSGLRYFCQKCTEYIQPAIIRDKSGKPHLSCESCFLDEVEKLEWVVPVHEPELNANIHFCEKDTCMEESSYRCGFCDKRYCQDHVSIQKESEDGEELVICESCTKALWRDDT